MVSDGQDVTRARLAADGTREVEDRQIEAWRRMSSVETAEILGAAWIAGTQLAWFGVRDRYPDAPEAELRLRLAIVLLGPEFAGRVYPDAVTLLGG